MRGIIRRLKRIVLSVIGCHLTEQEDPMAAGPPIVAKLSSDLIELRAAAVRVIANQYRIQRMLDAEREKLAQMDADAHAAAVQGDSELADILRRRRDLCEARVNDFESQVESARRHAADARQQVETFRDKLEEISSRARDAQIRYQLSKMRAQAEMFALSGSREDDIRAIEHMQERADLAAAEAAALVELRDALGLDGRSEL